MITVYRIAKSQHIHDLSGKGAQIAGGRWTPKGVAVVYAAESRALAALEYLGHMEGRVPKKSDKLSLASIEVPVKSLYMVDVTTLPSNWRDPRPPGELQQIGLDWIRLGNLVVKVPSVHVSHEYNVLINPKHQDMKLIKIIDVEEFIYDERFH